jgi:transposase
MSLFGFTGIHSNLSSMKENDARRCSLPELHERRKQIVRLHLKGHKVMKVAELAGVSHATARRAIDLYEEGGMKALVPAARGTSEGAGRALSPEQEKLVRKAIRDSRPEQLKLDFALWNRNAVRELIPQEFDIELSPDCISDYLKRWGYTPQKPVRRACEQNPQAVRKWLDEEYPAIAERCDAEKGEIYWCDETSFMNTDVHGRSYAPRGQTPIVPTPAARRKLLMISSVSNRGDARWMIV